MIRPWPRLASQPVFDAGLFSVTRDRTRSPRTGAECEVHVVHMVDWLMTVALTADGELVLVRQYRHSRSLPSTRAQTSRCCCSIRARCRRASRAAR